MREILVAPARCEFFSGFMTGENVCIVFWIFAHPSLAAKKMPERKLCALSPDHGSADFQSEIAVRRLPEMDGLTRPPFRAVPNGSRQAHRKSHNPSVAVSVEALLTL
jgi:hypothetical protein